MTKCIFAMQRAIRACVKPSACSRFASRLWARGSDTLGHFGVLFGQLFGQLFGEQFSQQFGQQFSQNFGQHFATPVAF